MALAANDLYSESTRGPLTRIQPAAGPGSALAKPFAADAGGSEVVLAVGTPVAVNTSGLMVKLTPAGNTATVVNTTPATYFAEQVYGIVWPAPVTIKASGGGEVVGTVMLRGSVAYGDLFVAMGSPTSTALTNLLLCLRNPIVRERGIHIDDLALSLG